MHVKLKKTEKVKINSASEIYPIIRGIFMRESKVSRNREHFWTVCLDNANRILNIELVSLGTIKEVLIAPMEVLSIPLQKKAVKIILIHNHPSGQLFPSEQDKDRTDHLIQACKLMEIDVLDHLIITEKDYYSFEESGLLDQLRQSLKYALNFNQPNTHHKESVERGEKKGKKDRTIEIARTMKNKGAPIELIMEYTGLPKATILKLKVD